jgi:putative Mg2+ transporter-C (MgtC) family protein
MDIDWAQVWYHLWHLAFAYLLALPIGLNRETSEIQFGMRTFPLVAVVTCGFMLVGISVLDSTGSEARVFQGLVTGIGFLGGGAILKHRESVIGTATAASIWNMGAIGVATAFNRYEIAIVLSAVNYLTLKMVGRLKEKLSDEEPEH